MLVAHRALYLSLHGQTKPREGFVSNCEVVCVSLSLKWRGPRFLMAIEARKIPMIAEMDNNIRAVMDNRLANPIHMIQRNTGPNLCIRYDKDTFWTTFHRLLCPYQFAWELKSGGYGTRRAVASASAFA